MIKSKKDYYYYLEADRIAKAIPKTSSIRQYFINWLIPNEVWRFQKLLRKLEYYKNCKKGILAIIIRFFITRKFKKLSYKLGFSIPANVFGPGLSIAHHGVIIVNGGANIGANCRIHSCVNIGTEAGYGDKAPQIGNNCYIGPGAKLYGSIEIPDNVAVGANSVVNKTFSEANIAIAGIPAKKIAEIDIYRILIPGSEIVDKGLIKLVDDILKTGDRNLTSNIKKLLDDM
jgi:serine O-acetyltransferase